ncbi:MAG: CHASE2 domain-containing protein [Limnobacter sp.]|nr:CHASE2 domain-containing protein [Limnobacter sp.]
MLVAHFVAPVRWVENWLADLRIVQYSPLIQATQSEVVLITFTDETLDKLPYRHPIDRAFLSEVLHHIDESQPKVMGVTLELDRPTEPYKDEELKRTLLNLQSRIFFVWKNQPEAQNNGWALAGNDAGSGNRTPHAPKPLSPAQASFMDNLIPPSLRAHIGLHTGPFDDVVREVVEEPSVSGHSMVYALTGQPAPVHQWLPWYRQLRGSVEPPFTRYPAHLVFEAPLGWLTGKIVLIGTDLPQADRYPTPLSAGLAKRPTAPWWKFWPRPPRHG